MTQKVAILGGGESGVGAAVLAKKKGLEVFLSEYGKLKDPYRDVLLKHDIETEEGGHSDPRIFDADFVVKSPGIPEQAEVIQKIRAADIPVISEIEFASRYTQATLIAITGSNGKTTTASLVFHILEKAGLSVALAGNVGNSFTMLLCDENPEYIVLEVSSFQLDDIEAFRPHIAMVLNITPDHLDRYEQDVVNYALAKFRIAENQESGDYLIYCADDEFLQSWMDESPPESKALGFTLTDEQQWAAWLEDETLNINLNNNKFSMSIQKLALQGKHNIYNSMAAGIAGRILDIRKEVIRDSLSDFQNVEHRLEHVVNVSGVKYINDSKATNVNSTWWALESMTRPTVWIVGGVDKGNDYSSLIPLVREKVKGIICLGKDNKKLHKAFGEEVELIADVENMKDAVSAAYRMAQKGDTVLLSPACASFDLFENYEDRGWQFKNWVRNL